MAVLIRRCLPERNQTRRYIDRVLRLLSWLQVLLCCLTVSAQREDVPPVEYQIKASLIFNFLQYVDWPPEIAQLRICVAGPDPFGVALAPLEREVVRGKNLLVEHLLSPAPEELKRCQVVFFSADFPLLGPVLGELQGASVLTIGETRDFLSRGGIISLQLEGNKVVFDINRDAALAGPLEVSSKLLRIARRVGSG